MPADVLIPAPVITTIRLAVFMYSAMPSIVRALRVTEGTLSSTEDEDSFPILENRLSCFEGFPPDFGCLSRGLRPINW